jgi:hypothetical protein
MKFDRVGDRIMFVLSFIEKARTTLIVISPSLHHVLKITSVV